MTINERIKAAIQNMDCEKDDLNKIVALAYYMGREEATKEISDRYNNHIAEQKKRAAACRYHKMAAEIVGPEDYLYSGDYASEMTLTFGDDPTEL